MPGKSYDKLYELALDQYGFVSADQSKRLGVNTQTLRNMCARGTVERTSRGVYRISAVPSGKLGQYMQAVLWPQRVRGVISHETALDLFNVSDVNPSKIHITVPRGFRSRRDTPKQYVLHLANLDSTDRSSIEGIPVTSLRRTIADCYSTHLGETLLMQAIHSGLHQSYLSPDEAKELRHLILERGRSSVGESESTDA